MITRLLDLPGIADLERFVMIYSTNDPGFFGKLCGVSFPLFGDVVYRSGLYEPNNTNGANQSAEEEADDSEDDWDYEDEKENTLDTLQVAKLPMDEEIVDYLKTIGWDLTDERGQPIRLTKWFAETIEAAHKGLAGKLPDQSKISNARFTEKMEAQARNWKPSVSNTAISADSVFRKQK